MSAPAAALAVAGGLLFALACVRPPVAPPAIFPVSTTWVAPIGQILEGPLATDGSRIFAVTREGAVLAVDAATGGVAWRVESGTGPITAIPAVLVQRQPDGVVVSLDPANGKIRWRSPSGIEGATPAVVDGENVIVAGLGAAALELRTGKVLWSLPGSPKATSPPAAYGPWIFAGEEDGSLRCRDRATGTSLWTYKTAEAILAAPVVDVERRVFLGGADRGFHSLDSKGKRRWRWKLGADVQFAPVLYHDTVLVAGHDDVLYSLRRKAGDLAWRSVLPSRPLSGPILVGSAVLVACYENDVASFDAETGRSLGVLRAPTGLRNPPVVIGDRLYAGLRDRTIVAFRLGDPTAIPTPTPSPAAVPVASPPAGATPSPGPSQAPSPRPTDPLPKPGIP